MNKRYNSRGAQPRRNALVIALAMGLGFTGFAYGQATTGSIFGTAPVASGETVVVTGGNGTNRSVSVDASGRYTVSGLPVGSYTVTLKKDGETVATRDNVYISVGGGTEVPFASASADSAQNLGEVQVVASALPAIDVTSVNSSTVITAADLQKLPVGRSAESIALLAPGAVQGSGFFNNAVSFGGAGVTENAYYVNGYNTGEPYRNTGGFQLPYGSIDQQQTYTGGYSAQYGRSDGGVINQIGKRGTNEWHFGGQIAWAPRFLDAGGKNVYYPTFDNLPAGFGVANPAREGTLYRYKEKNKSWETIYSAYVGGPLIQDKLYMFLSAETSKTKGRNVQSIGGKDVYYSNHSTHIYGKLDWNINDSNVLELTTLKSDETTNKGSSYDFDYSTLTSGAFSSANNANVDSAEFVIGKYTSYIGDNATLSVTYGKGDFKNPVEYANNSPNPRIGNSGNQRPADGGPDITNDQTSYYKYSEDAANHTDGLRADFSYQLGDHLLGVGIDNMQYSASNQGQTMSGPGYAYIYYNTTDPSEPIAPELGVGAPGGDGYYVDKYIFSVRTSMTMKQKAYYIQDVWNVTDNFQLNLGLRNDHFTNYNDLGIAFVDEKNQWEPRIGASWDVNGDSSFKVYGNAGRYYLALPNNVAERAANRSTYTDQYFNYSGIDANGVPQNLTPVVGADGNPAGPGPVSANFETGEPKDAKQVAALDLKAQYQDEYILGFDKTLGPDWVYGAKVTYRELKTAIDDECDPFGSLVPKLESMGLDPNDYYGALVNPYCRLFNPGSTNTFALKSDVDGSYTNVTMSAADWGYTNGGAKRTYKGVDLYLEHPFDGKWQGRIDYTWSKNEGNTEGQVRSDFGQGDVSKTEDWDSWQLMAHGDGYLANDRRHSIRIRGAYQVTPEWLVSGTLLAQSGTPKACFGFYGDNQSDPTGYGSDYHYCFGQPSPRGAQGFTPWTKKLNLGVRYTPAFADNKLALQLQIYNVLNSQKPLQVDPRSQPRRAKYTVSNTYGMGQYFETPRYVRLSVSYDY